MKFKASAGENIVKLKMGGPVNLNISRNLNILLRLTGVNSRTLSFHSSFSHFFLYFFSGAWEGGGRERAMTFY